MRRQRLFVVVIVLFLTTSCDRNSNLADAYGNFEADETIIAAQMPGELVMLNIEEGMILSAGTRVGLVDSVGLHLKKLEILANRKAIASNSESILAEIEVLNGKLANLERERARVTNLIQAGAATQQKLDDIEGEITVVKSQMRSVHSQNAAILGQVEALDVKVSQVAEDIRKSQIINPVRGEVLAKLAEAHEFMTPGKALYKVADLTHLDLRAFISGAQLSSVELGAKHEVKIDGPDGEMISYPGTVTWISTEAEFTPKTIQTKEQRLDLVYAVKVRVRNDGKIKIGMPGELWLVSKHQ
jgi:HlyD family secretion protein